MPRHDTPGHVHCVQHKQKQTNAALTRPLPMDMDAKTNTPNPKTGAQQRVSVDPNVGCG